MVSAPSRDELTPRRGWLDSRRLDPAVSCRIEPEGRTSVQRSSHSATARRAGDFVLEAFAKGLVRQADGDTLVANSISRPNHEFWLNGSDSNIFTENNVADARDWFGYGIFGGSDTNSFVETRRLVSGGRIHVWASSNDLLTNNVASHNFGNRFGANEIGTEESRRWYRIAGGRERRFTSATLS